MVSSIFQQFIEEIESLKLEITSEKLEQALKCIREGNVPPLKHLIEITELLQLSSGDELLKESIAVEKENIKVKVPFEQVQFHFIITTIPPVGAEYGR